jgi:hypothetical protein
MVTEKIIVEVSGLPNEGTPWKGKYTTLKEVVESFMEPREELDKKGKGLNPATLSEPWRELTRVIQMYTTCDGRYDVVIQCHLKLLVALKHRLVINLPFFLNAMLHVVAARTLFALFSSMCEQNVSSYMPCWALQSMKTMM